MLRFAMTLFACLLLAAVPCLAGETLYNGIELPDAWPPRPTAFARDEPTTTPYLVKPPKVISIDVGRQLFVDDFLIEQTTLKRTFHQPRWHEKSPVLRAEHSWEKWRDQPFAAPFSDGVWYDPADKTIKMWYLVGTGAFFGYATSPDGITWTKPIFEDGRLRKTNTLDIRPESRDSSTLWLDLEEKDPARRFKLMYYRSGLQFRTSADGIHFSDVIWSTKSSGDRSTFFYNPFRKVWVYSIRTGRRGIGRCRYYGEHTTFAAKAWERIDDLSMWACADKLDRVREETFEGDLPDLYNLDATPYESLMLGLFVIHSKVADDKGRPKINHVTLGYSRDGFHWHRPDRRAFLNVSEDREAWNYGNVQPAGGGCLVMGDKLYFYCSGRNSHKVPDDGSGGSTGLALLRRDGFASLDAGDETGTLTTRPVRFTGTQLFVNVNAPRGELRVEVLDEAGKAIEPFTLANCQTVTTDSTLAPITWKGATDLSALKGKAVRFRFHLTRGKLYAFWVSPDKSGASHGYIAAGGPGFTSNRDTVGKASLRD
ncbi:MAG: hypothetical protein WD768_17940 [Phycisphaeraceae bacterium]